jgi:hypothetical protein
VSGYFVRECILVWLKTASVSNDDDKFLPGIAASSIILEPHCIWVEVHELGH